MTIPRPMKTGTLFITFFLLLISSILSGQSDVSTWQSKNIKNLRNGEETPYVCSFRIYPDKIEWIQLNGENVTTFQITSTRGTLSEKEAGQVSYDIIKEGHGGTITIKRIKSDEIILTLDLSSLSSISAYYQFDVTKN